MNNGENKIVYLKVTERIDQFAHKRYTNPKAEIFRSVFLRGVKVDEKDTEVMVKLEGNNGFERDNETYVFHKNLLLSGEPSSVELGKWVKRNGEGEIIN